MAHRWEPPPPSPDGAAASVLGGPAASSGKASAAWPVPVPPRAPVAPHWLIRWRMCCHLDRLAGELKRAGWSTVLHRRRLPPLLRVFSATAPHVTENVLVEPGAEAALWYRSTRGYPLAPIADPGGAVWEIAIALTPRVAAALVPTTREEDVPDDTP